MQRLTALRSPMLRAQVQALRLRIDAPWPSEQAKARRRAHRLVLVVGCRIFREPTP